MRVYLIFIAALLLVIQASALEEIHLKTDDSKAILAFIEHTDPLLLQDSPQQKPRTPFSKLTYTFNIKGDLLKIEDLRKGLLLEVVYNNDQIDYVKDYEKKITVKYIYQNGVLNEFEYYDLNNLLIEKEYIYLTPYTGTSPSLANSIFLTNSYELFNPSTGILPYKDKYLAIPYQKIVFPKNVEYSSLSFYKVYGSRMFLERTEYYESFQKVMTLFNLRDTQGRLTREWYVKNPANQILAYQNFYYHSCPNDEVLRTVVQYSPRYGLHILDYVYDNPDVCNPLTNLMRIRDRNTATNAYRLRYFIPQ